MRGLISWKGLGVLVFFILMANMTGVNAGETIITLATDTQAVYLASPAQGTSWVSLAWDVSTTEPGPFTYSIWRNGGLVGSTVNRTFTDINLVPNTNYTYVIGVSSAAGNGTDSAPFIAQTAPQPASSSFTMQNKTYRARPSDIRVNKSYWVGTAGLIEDDGSGIPGGANYTLNFNAGSRATTFSVFVNVSGSSGIENCILKARNSSLGMATIPNNGTVVVLYANATSGFVSQLAIVPLNASLNCRFALVSSP